MYLYIKMLRQTCYITSPENSNRPLTISNVKLSSSDISDLSVLVYSKLAIDPLQKINTMYLSIFSTKHMKMLYFDWIIYALSSLVTVDAQTVSNLLKGERFTLQQFTDRLNKHSQSLGSLEHFCTMLIYNLKQ